jgi:hypothetical protein
MRTGSCLCGAVKFTVEGELKAPLACHCTQCRKTSGHYWAATNVPRGALTIEGEFNVAWFRSSEKIQRGFCSTCGASLFWDPIEEDRISVAMGAFEAPTGTKISEHIFVDDKGDYYEIKDGLPQTAQY